jgi:hypothetical protein
VGLKHAFHGRRTLQKRNFSLQSGIKCPESTYFGSKRLDSEAGMIVIRGFLWRCAVFRGSNAVQARPWCVVGAGRLVEVTRCCRASARR